MTKNILIITTNVDIMDGDYPTGLWLEEFTTPYRLFIEAGYGVTVASPRGGKTPIDVKSLDGVDLDDFKAELALLEETEILAKQEGDRFDAIYFPGGHGPIHDLPGDPHVKMMLKSFGSHGKAIGAVCHGVGALLEARLPNDRYLVDGRRLTAFTDSEEAAVALAERVPYSVEQRLVAAGARFERGEDWASYAVTDANLVTGQNPQSSKAVAEALIELLPR